MYEAHKNFKDVDGFSRVMTNKELLEKNANLNISLYISKNGDDVESRQLPEVVTDWIEGSEELKKSTKTLFEVLKK